MAELPPTWLVLLVASPAMGSFLGTVVLRSDNSRSILSGRSHCDGCGHVLAGWDMIPIVSWLVLNRRCRYCQRELSLLYPAIEIAAAVPVLWAASVTSGLVLVASAILGWILLVLALIDWKALRLPDYLTLLLLGTGLGTALVFDRSNFLGHIVGCVAGFLVFAGLALAYRHLRKRDGLGLGDAKMLAGLGAWVSWEGLPTVILFAALVAIGAACVRAFVLGKDVLPAAGTDRIPFGPFLALAGWIVWLYGPLMIA